MNFLIDEPVKKQSDLKKSDLKKSDLTLVFAHGAGAGMDSDFMQALAGMIAEQGVRVVRFEFPYMAQRRVDDKQRPPDRMPVLLECFAQAIALQGGPQHCVAAGKSMGGRVASMLLAQRQCVAGVSLGYPFHPPAKPDQWRNEHWPQISKPWLIVQGDRDSFGTRAEVEREDVPAEILWLPDGDHDFKPRQRSGFTQWQHWQTAAAKVAWFVRHLRQI